MKMMMLSISIKIGWKSSAEDISKVRAKMRTSKRAETRMKRRKAKMRMRILKRKMTRKRGLKSWRKRKRMNGRGIRIYYLSKKET